MNEAASARETHARAETPALAVTGLGYSYGPRQALKDVSFDLAPGSFTVLLGPNGAGKTTLFSLITRLFDSRLGSIRVYGFEVRRRPSQALRRIGVVFQQRTLDLDLTVAQNLRYHAALHGIERREARLRIDSELARAGLGERADDKVRQLSGGEARRVEIARALLHRPRLLLLDEPTVGLDIPSRRRILDHAHRLAEDGIALLWATHLIDEAAPGDRVIVLHGGRVAAQGNAVEIARAAGAADLGAAFTALTSAPPR